MVPCSEIVRLAEFRKRQQENRTGGKKFPFRVPFTFASSPLSESLEQAGKREAGLSKIHSGERFLFFVKDTLWINFFVFLGVDGRPTGEKNLRFETAKIRLDGAY